MWQRQQEEEKGPDTGFVDEDGATWAIEQQAREIDVQFLLGHSTPNMLRRDTATYDAEKAAQAHASFSPADRLNGRLKSQRSSPAAGPSKARFHPGFTPDFESEALAISPSLAAF